MFGRNKKDTDFYNSFESMIEKIHTMSVKLNDILVENYKVSEKINSMEKIKTEFDKDVERVNDLLKKVYITPLDREDIYAIIKSLENLLNEIISIGYFMSTLKPMGLNFDPSKLSTMLVKTVNEIQGLVQQLRYVKKRNSVDTKIKTLRELTRNSKEEYVLGIDKLLSNSKNLQVIVKFKEVLDRLDKAIYMCKTTADTIEGIIIKYV